MCSALLYTTLLCYAMISRLVDRSVGRLVVLFRHRMHSVVHPSEYESESVLLCYYFDRACYCFLFGMSWHVMACCVY